MDLPLITIPPSAPHTHTIVFLHGRGGTARTFAESLRYSQDSHGRTLQQSLPSFRWVFPQSEIRPSASFPGDKLPQWFDICNVSDFSVREELQAEGLRESVTGILRILASDAATLGGQWHRLVLAGISQGAATSVHTLLNLNLPVAIGADGQQIPGRLGAFLGFSCRMPFPGRSLAETRRILALEVHPYNDENDILQNTPVLLEHCVDDPLVLIGLGRGLRDTLLGFGSQVTWKEYEEGGHWFNSPQGMDDVVDFLKSHVAHLPNAGGSNSLTEIQTLPDCMDLS